MKKEAFSWIRNKYVFLLAYFLSVISIKRTSIFGHNRKEKGQETIKTRLDSDLGRWKDTSFNFNYSWFWLDCWSSLVWWSIPCVTLFYHAVILLTQEKYIYLSSVWILILTQNIVLFHSSSFWARDLNP